MKDKHKRQSGMTLLEVMVALMIFAIGCMALIKTTGRQVQSLGRDRSEECRAVGGG